MLNRTRRTLVMGVLACAAWVAGCASSRLIDSEVRSFGGGASAVSAASYQFERLPSQQADALAQAQIEQGAMPVLQRMGLTHASQDPRYTVQLSVASEQVQRADPLVLRRWSWIGPRPGVGVPLAVVSLEPALYRLQIQVLVRDAQSRAVVYEASAQHTGPWNDQATLLPAVLLAAMRDFPQGGNGPASIRVEIGTGGLELRP